MAKPTLKKTAPVAQTETPTPVVRATRTRNKVLVDRTPAQLAKLIGEDTPVGVSLKHLKALVASQKTAEILADAGL